MKKTLFLLILAVASIVAIDAFGINPASSANTKESATRQAVRLTAFEGKKITGIDVSSLFNVTVKQGTDTKVVVEISPEIEKYLDLRLQNGIAIIGVKSEANMKNKSDIVMRAEITLPVLNKVVLGGLSVVNFQGNFTADMCNFLSTGLSKVYNLNIKCKDMKINVMGTSYLDSFNVTASSSISAEFSGASGNKGSLFSSPKISFENYGSSSSLQNDIKCQELSIEASGASTVKSKYSAKSVSLGAAGGCNVDIIGDCDKLSAEASGASKVSFNGKGVTLFLTATGAAKANFKDFEAVSVKVESSGASNVVVDAKNDLSATATGASSIRYVSKPPKYNVSSSPAARVSKL